MNRIINNYKILFQIILLQNRYSNEYAKVLPDSIKQILLVYFELQQHLVEDGTDVYEVMLLAIVGHVPKNILKKYILLAKNFNIKRQKKIINILMEKYQWKTAYILLNELISKGQADYGLLYNYARCLYFNDELCIAKKYFLQAKSVEIDNNAINSYLKWINDKEKNRNNIGTI